MSTTNYRSICYKLNSVIEILAQAFLEEYFTYEDWSMSEDFFFVNDGDSSSLNYNFFVDDMHFTLDDMFVALWYNVDRKDLYQWYDQWNDITNKERCNLRTFISLKKQQWTM